MTTPLEDLARLAVPVRHEVNNLLAALSGTVDILLRTAAGDRDRARAERLRDATARLEALLKAYLGLAAPPAAAGGTDAAQILALLRPLIVLTLGPGRALEVAAAAEVPRVATAAADLQAAVLALVRDAAVDLPPGSGLRLTLEPVPEGISLTATPVPEGEAPRPLILRAAAG